MIRCNNCMKLIDSGQPSCPECGFTPEYYQPECHTLPVGATLQEERYQVGRVIGEGGFGITYIGYDNKFKCVVAIKEFYNKLLVTRDNTVSHTIKLYNTRSDSLRRDYEKELERVEREAQTMRQFQSHKGIVQVMDYFSENDTMYIVMQYIEGDTLKEYCAKGNTITIDDFEPIIYVLYKLHTAGIIHRDLGLDNIMVDSDGSLKILDFGSARSIDMKQTSSVTVKYGYAPPEQYSPNENNQGPWIDVYALCVCMWNALTGSILEDSLVRKNEELNVTDRDKRQISHQVQNTLQKGLCKNYRNRIQNMNELYFELYGRWIEEIISAPSKKAVNPFIAFMEKIHINRDIRKKIIEIAVMAIVLFCVAFGFYQIGVSKGKEYILTTENSTTEDSIMQESMSEEESTEEPLSQSSTEAPQTATPLLKSDSNQNTVFFGTDIMRSEVKTITFYDTLEDAPANAYDISEKRDGGVLAWTTPNSSYYDMHIAGNGKIQAPQNCRDLFSNYENLTSIDFRNCFDTSNATDMSFMFAQNPLLTTLDLSGFNTSNVNTLIYMFSGCESLTSVNLNSFDTANVTRMNWMFTGCTELVNVNVSHFDTSNVYNMNGMFAYCMSLTNIDVSNWNTSNVEFMGMMFEGCNSLTDINVSNWDTSKVTDMGWMFAECTSLESKPNIKIPVGADIEDMYRGTEWES